jgi:serine protease
LFHFLHPYKQGFFAGLLLLAIAFSGFGPAVNVSAQANQQQTGQAGSSTDQIIIKYKSASIAFKAPAQVNQMTRLNGKVGLALQYFRKMSGDASVLRLPARLPLAQVQAITAELMTLPEVEYAEPDQVILPALVPNDTQYSDQWDLSGVNGINMPAAWDITTGSSRIVIADIDTGITNHADLSGRTVPGFDFISDPASANDGDGRDANPGDPGDWVTAQDLIQIGICFGQTIHNSTWHGTHTAGTLGAIGNNNLGVAGINWNSPILPVRVLGKCGGVTSDILDAVRWAAGLPVAGVPDNAHPAKVLNLSLGAHVSTPVCSAAWQSAINDAYAAGTVIVAAAGNGNNGAAEDASHFTPGNCDNLITVAATDINGNRATYSNFGALVEIAAPGGGHDPLHPENDILSTFNTGATIPVIDAYAYDAGTSMAAPHVTGVVSLMLSVNPTLSPAVILQILQRTARPFPSGSTCISAGCGSGLLDALAVLKAVQGTRSFIPLVLHQ